MLLEERSCALRDGKLRLEPLDGGTASERAAQGRCSVLTDSG